MASPDVTRLLQDLEAGRQGAFDHLLAQVYTELRVLARARMRGERADHTLNTTALVHEAYLRLADVDRMTWKNRAHFFGTASRAMRNVLVDYARAKATQKRSGQRVSLTQAGPLADVSLAHVLDVHDALAQLGAVNPRWERVVECRYFAGLTLKETAEALGISETTVSEDWRLARAWLHRSLKG